MTYGWRYCVCGKRYQQNNASTTKCPECMEEIRNPKGAVLESNQKVDYCTRCDKNLPHTLVGPYHGKCFWKCKCGRWKSADIGVLISQGWID